MDWTNLSDLKYHYTKLIRKYGVNQGPMFSKIESIRKQIEKLEKSKRDPSQIVKHSFASMEYKLKPKQFSLYFSDKGNMKICIITIEKTLNVAKGITIDDEIMEKNLKNIGLYNIETQSISLHDINGFIKTINLQYDLYIFNEFFCKQLFEIILSCGKNILFIPNIDSYSTFKPPVKNRVDDFHDELLYLSNRYQTMSIGCKTKQIEFWMKSWEIPNLYYLHFQNNLKSSPIEQINFKTTVKEPILLDTGTSISRRKYLREIIHVFQYNPSIPFHLIIKTTPNVYNKFLENLEINQENITIFNSFEKEESGMDKYYKNIKYFIYLSKFDGYGLSLSKAIQYGMFIFCLNGKPWNELLENYPRKCFIKCYQDLSKTMGNSKKGYALSQIYYKADFVDFKEKVSILNPYENIIQSSVEETNFHNVFNTIIFQMNLYYFFKNVFPDDDPSYYESSIGILSFHPRGLILLENILELLPQSNSIYIYLNSTTRLVLSYLTKINCVSVVPFENDYRALSKFLIPKYFQTPYGFILDDDIIYPPNFISYSCKILQSNSRSFLSYNGFSKENKYSFQKIFREPHDTSQKLGTGTLFFHSSFLSTKNLQSFLNDSLTSNNQHVTIFADDLFFKFCQHYALPCQIISPLFIKWMCNHPKIKHFQFPGLFEFKKHLSLIDENHISTLTPREISFYVIGCNTPLPLRLYRQLSGYFFVEATSPEKEYRFTISNSSLFDNDQLVVKNLTVNSFLLYMNSILESEKTHDLKKRI